MQISCRRNINCKGVFSHEHIFFCFVVSASRLPLYLYKNDGSVPIEAGMVKSDEEASEISFLHEVLLVEWDNRKKQGLFRHDVTKNETKSIPGQHGFIVQLNEERLLKKRPTEFRLDQVLQPFDDSKFNFTKVGQEEALFLFEQSSDHKSHFVPNAPVEKISTSPNVVAINVKLKVIKMEIGCVYFGHIKIHTYIKSIKSDFM